MEIINKFDDFFIYLINHKLKNKYLDKFMYEITDYGGAIANTKIALILLALGLVLNNTLKILGMEILVVLAINQSIVQLIKLAIRRERPYVAREDINSFNIIMRDYSFPSGHTTSSFTLATMVYLILPNYFIIALIFAIIIGFSRIYLGVHYPSDVLFGMVFAIISSLIVHKYVMPYVYIFLGKIF